MAQKNNQFQIPAKSLPSLGHRFLKRKDMPIQVQVHFYRIGEQASHAEGRHLQAPPLYCLLASFRLFLFHSQSACFICACIIYYRVTLQSLHFVHFAGGHATHRSSKLLMLNRICSSTMQVLLCSRFPLFVCEVMNFPTTHLQPFISFIGMISVCLSVLYYAYFAWRCYRYCYLGYP